MLQLAILIIVAASLLVIVAFTLINGISPMPSSAVAAQAIVDTCKCHKVTGPILELGSGWGGLARRLAKEFPEIKVMGFENCPVPYLWSRLTTWVFKRENLKFRLADFYHADLSNAETVVCYLCPSAMQKLSGKLRRELKPGSLILTSTFALPEWQPIEVTEALDLFRSKIYVYRA
jgi:hypothetical protein